MQSVNDLVPYLENLKVSSFKKVGVIKKDIHNVTIGPESVTLEESSISKFTNDDYDKSPSKKNLTLSPSSNVMPIIKRIEQEFEIERQEDCRKCLEDRIKRFHLFDEDQNRKLREKWVLRQRELEQKYQLKEREILKAVEECNKKNVKNDEQILQYYKELEEKRKKSAEILEAKRKEKELMKECLECQAKFHSIYEEIMMIIKSCPDEKVKVTLSPTWKQCKELNDIMTATISKCKSNISEEVRNIAETILSKTIEIKNEVNEIIAKHEQLKKLELEKQKELEKQIEMEKKLDLAKPSGENTIVEKVVKEKPEVVVSALNQYVNRTNLQWYTEIVSFYGKYIESFKEVLDNVQLKLFRSDCKKAVNLSVNTISAVNASHLSDKYIKLSNLLNGKNVVIGDFQICASKHPKGIPFSIDLLARKFVLQGDMMISSNPEAAFAYATVIVSLWSESLEFSKILLAYFFKECPYLVPFYLPKTVDQTDEEFYKSQGYRYIDGQIEKQDKFLKRMTGIMRLYFAILIASPRKGHSRNSYNLKIAWAWFVSVLQLEPRIDITATMLHTFFETIGFQMQNVYKNQFFKLFKYLIECYLPILKKFDTGGPVTRLECLIQEFKDNGNKFKPPNGILSENFW